MTDRRNLSLPAEVYRRLLLMARKTGKPISRLLDEWAEEVAPQVKN